MSEIVTMPQLGETVTEGTILRWLVQVGDDVKEDDPILEISTDKVDTEVPSPFSGKVTSLLVEEGETVEVGASLLELDGDSSSPSVEEKASSKENNITEPVKEIIEEVKAEVSTPSPSVKNNNLKLSPVVRKIVSENQLDLQQISGTGSGGRITRKDVEAYMASGSVAKKQPNDTPVQKEVKQTESPKATTGEISRLRRRIAENMVMSKQTSAHVMTSVEVDYENVEILRSKHKKSFKE